MCNADATGGPCDIRFLEPLLAQALAGFLGRHAFSSDPPEVALQEPQGQWLCEHVQGAAPRGTILMTHHQPFSAYETVDTPLLKTIGDALAGHRIEAWLWGHEHRCAVYPKNVSPLDCYAALIGHGGVPSLRSARVGPEGQSDVDPKDLQWEFLDYYEVGEDHWGLGGFAVLTFSGAKLEIQYYDEYGKERRKGDPLGYASETTGAAAASAVADEREVYPPDVIRAPEVIGAPVAGAREPLGGASPPRESGSEPLDGPSPTQERG